MRAVWGNRTAAQAGSRNIGARPGHRGRPPGGTYQMDALRSYLESAGPRVARAAFYRGFDAPLEQFRDTLAEHALAYARAQGVDLAGILSEVKAWGIIDAPPVTVRDVLRGECHGTGAYS